MPKNAEIYRCEKCNFICSKKSNYDKHLTTAKHKSATNSQPKNAKKCRFICGVCNKEYRDRTGLWRHSKKCNVQIPEENLYENPEIEVNIDVDTVVPSDNNSNILLELVKQNQELMTSNQEFKELMVEQQKENHELQKQLVDSVKHSSQTITNNTINNNQKFNLNFFLNEQCKDAMNLSDFMESIQLSLEDLENMEKLGYVECMFKNIFGDMEFISIFDRPFHCSDFKRGIVYIKENGVWEKEDMGYTRLINAIRIVEKKNFKLLKEWTEKHPSFSDYNSPDNDKYVKLFGETMSGDKHNLSKLIRKLSKECVIDKSNI